MLQRVKLGPLDINVVLLALALLARDKRQTNAVRQWAKQLALYIEGNHLLPHMQGKLPK